MFSFFFHVCRSDDSNAWDEQITCPQMRQSNIGDEPKANLTLQVQSVDDDFVDTKLLLELLLKMHADEKDGAILVF